MSSCDFHVVLYLYSGIDATSTLLWDYAAMKAVWDHTRSFLRHHCRLSFELTGACDFIVVLRHHCRSLRYSCRLFLRHNRRLVATSLPTCHLRSQALATSLSSYDIIVVHCGTHADLWLAATFPLLWDLAASFDEAVRDQNLSLFLRHHRRLVAASLPTFSSAHRRLRLHCRLTTSLSFIAALMPTCG
jgi:hypothetical protein